MNQHPLTNTGLIEQAPLITQWVLGAETGIKAVVVMASGQWDQYLPTFESQLGVGFESNLCVTFSGLNVIETYVDFLVATKQLSDLTIQQLTDLGFFDENGKFNCNEMFSANLNGSTQNGNSLGNFWESIHRDGLLPQRDWLDIHTQVHSFSELYQPVPQNLKDKAKKILNILDINFHWVLTGTPNLATLREALKQSPLHVATPVCPSWNSGDVTSCGSTQLAHATMIYGYDSTSEKDFDHYNPANKKLSTDYYIPYAIACSIKEKALPVKPNKPHFVFTRQLSLGNRGGDVLALQDILIYEGFLNSKLNTSYFGENTKQAVMKFQEKYKTEILSPLGLITPTGFVGQKTLNKLNELYGYQDAVSEAGNPVFDAINSFIDLIASWFKK